MEGIQGLGPDEVIDFKRIELDKIYNSNLTGHLTEIRQK